jgi:hypothetical protein
MFQTSRLKIAAELPEAKTLINELLNFKVKINVKTAHDSYEAWREGVHDDLVLAVALSVWYMGNSTGQPQLWVIPTQRKTFRPFGDIRPPKLDVYRANR